MALPTAKTRVATSLRDYITMFYGPPGVGKSTFVNEFGAVLFLSTDRGTRFMEAMRQECLKWDDFERAASELERPGAPRFDFICIDHVDDMASMAEEQVCKDLGIDSLGDAGFGKGWKAYRNYLEDFVRRMMRLNTGVVFIAHEEIKTVKTRSIETQRVMPAMGKSAWKVIVPLADIIGYCGYKTIKIPTGGVKEVRIIDTNPREDLYAKDRTTRQRPAATQYELLNGAVFISTFSNGDGAKAVNDNGTKQSISSSNSTRTNRQTRSRQATAAVGRRARS